MVEVMREGLPGVTMTAAVKDELSRIDLTRSCCRRAEVSTLLRFAGGLHVVAGGIVTAAELDGGSTAKRLRTAIGEFYGYPSTVRVLTTGGVRAGVRYVVRVATDGEALARRTGAEHRGAANRLATFDDANQRRAAVTAAARVDRALPILGDDVPDHLAAAGVLRLHHRHASLEELGQLADPPLSKDAVAGRLRRLLVLADRVDRETGILIAAGAGGGQPSGRARS